MLSGKELRLMRVKLELRAKYIAQELNVTKGYISNLENEKQAIPSHIYKKWIIILKGDDQ